MNVKAKMIINAIERKFQNPANTLSKGVIDALVDAECYQFVLTQDDSVDMVAAVASIEKAGIEAKAHYGIK